MTPRTILCIRHGQSTANVAWENDAEDPLQIDARLTAKGEAQVRAARERLRHEPVELVITSPLTRALQTSTGIFADHPNRPPILVELASRPERTIAVVGHATFFWHLTGEMLENCGVARLQLDAGSAARAG